MGGQSIVSKVYCDTCEYLVDALKAGVFGFVWGKLYKKAVLEQNKILMNTQYANFEDEDFNLRYLLCCKTVQTLSVCNYIYCEPEYGKSYRSTDYMQQSILFLTSVKQMKNYEVYNLNSATLLIVSGHCGQNRPECDFSCSNWFLPCPNRYDRITPPYPHQG